MLEIVLIMSLLAVTLLAKRRSYPRRGAFGLRRVRTSPNLTLSTLASITAITAGLTGAADGAYRLVSAIMNWSIIGLTSGDGPIIVGYAYGDYTVTEIKEALEAGASINKGDMVAQEQANRKIRVVGVFSNTDELNHGEPVKTRLNWLIPIGTVVNMFAYNDGAALLSTGAIVSCFGSLWVKDSD